MGNSEPPPARSDIPPEVQDLQAGPPIAPPDSTLTTGPYANGRPDGDTGSG
jgi:hypothetical protein